MRHISRTDIRENRLPEICLGMKLRTYWRDMVKLRVNEKNFQTMFATPIEIKNSKKRYTWTTCICRRGPRVIPLMLQKSFPSGLPSTSDFAMESAEIIPVTVNGLDGQLFLEENWKKQQSTVTCIDISSNL